MLLNEADSLPDPLIPCPSPRPHLETAASPNSSSGVSSQYDAHPREFPEAFLPKVVVTRLTNQEIARWVSSAGDKDGSQQARNERLKLVIRKMSAEGGTAESFQVVKSKKSPSTPGEDKEKADEESGEKGPEGGPADMERTMFHGFNNGSPDGGGEDDREPDDDGASDQEGQTHSNSSPPLPADGHEPHDELSTVGLEPSNSHGQTSGRSSPSCASLDSAMDIKPGPFLESQGGRRSPSGLSDASTIESRPSDPLALGPSTLRRPAAKSDDDDVSQASTIPTQETLEAVTRGATTLSRTIGGITVRRSADLLAPVPSQLTAHREPFTALQGLVSDIQTNDGLRVFSPVDINLRNGSHAQHQPPPQQLEHHPSVSGLPPQLGPGVVVTPAGPSTHQQGAHQQSAHQQGAHQQSAHQQGAHQQSAHQAPVIPNLPPGVQVSKRLAPPPQSTTPTKISRRGSDSDRGSPGVRLPDSITLVRPGVSITPSSPSSNGRPGSNSSSSSNDSASSVTDMLATRGITVVPSSGGRGAAAPPPALSVTKTTALPQALNSAVSITPASPTQNRQAGSFAVPGGRRGVPAPMRLPTIDLTADAAPPPPPPRPLHAGPPSPLRGPRAASRARVTCQVCDKIFASPEALQVHMQSHRQAGGPAGAPQGGRGAQGGQPSSRLPFECNLCGAQYPSQQGLLSHKQKYHQTDDATAEELAIPIVDIRQAGVMQRLGQLGVRHAIPLVQLHNQSNGVFCLPLIGLDSARNPAVCNIGGLGASNLFPLGPLRRV